MMYIFPQTFLTVRSVYWKDTSCVKINSWGKMYITTKQSPAILSNYYMPATTGFLQKQSLGSMSSDFYINMT